jgi:uncharacterized protein (DUF58 family)
VRRRASPRLGAYAGLAALGLLAALVLGRPELVAVAAPFALLLAVGLAAGRVPQLEVAGWLDRDRALEGDAVQFTAQIRALSPVDRVQVALALPAGLESQPATNPVALTLAANEERTLEFPVECARWGGYAAGRVVLRARDRLGLFVFEAVADRRSGLKVYPRAEHLLNLLRPLETQVYAGNQVARTKGDGIEFADIRQFTRGDRPRRINWRASARRGGDLLVNEMHPERNTDVILFLDTFSEARRPDEGTLDLTVRAAATLAAKYLERKDRVGVVGFGGILNWLLPATGLMQLYRIVDSLLDTEIVLNYAWKDIDVIPTRTLPPKALVLGLTPLLDERAVNALLDLRGRGFDVAVVEVSPIPFSPAGADRADEVAYRLWRMRRAALRFRFESMGVPVVEWRADAPLATALEEVSEYRKHVRLSRA